MKEIDLSKPTEQITCMIYGPSRSGKTEFAGTWPRPIFLADAAEGGYETLRHMDEKKFYEPGRRPIVHAIENVKDMILGIRDIGATVAKTPGKYLTGVIDSLTFFSELLQDTLIQEEGAQIEKNHYYLWDQLRIRLRHIVIEAHKIPIHWVWTCLLQEPDGSKAGGPMIAGKSSQTLPAQCKIQLYQRVFQANPSQPPIYETRTKQYGPFKAGGRLGAKLPDPLTTGTFKGIEQALGLPPAIAR